MRLVACVGLLLTPMLCKSASAAEALPAPKPLELTEGWGSIEGQFVVGGAAPVLRPIRNLRGGAQVPDERLLIDSGTKGIKNVVIYLKKAPAKVHPQLQKSSEKEVSIKGINALFSPRVLHVRTDQVVRLSSADGTDYHFNISPFVNTAWDVLLRAGQGPTEIQFPKPESLPISVRSDLHHWMRAWLVVTDHPYVGITDDKGRFRIEGLPVGEHGFTVWHEQAGYIEPRWTVEARGKEMRTLPATTVPVETFKLGS